MDNKNNNILETIQTLERPCGQIHTPDWQVKMMMAIQSSLNLVEEHHDSMNELFGKEKSMSELSPDQVHCLEEILKKDD